MKLNFGVLTADYQSFIDDMLSKTNYETSDYCLASVLFFTELESIEAAVDDIAMYIKCVYNDEVMFFSPLCEEKNYVEAINRMKRYCRENNIVLKFYATKNDVRLLLQAEGNSDERITQLFGAQNFKTKNFCFENDRNSADYIYKPEKLISLSGASYKSKRNEINAFEKTYQGRYLIRDMRDDDIEGILQLVRVWHKFKEFSASDEEERLKKIIELKDKLHINVVVMELDGKIVATSIYTIMKSNVGDEIFERCAPDYRDSYALMARFVANRLKDCRYINFEEDMGLEGLRFSKSSYKPEYLLEKFIVNQNVDVPLKRLYKDIFCDSDEFTDEIFSEHSQCSCSQFDVADGKIVACGFYRRKHLRVLNKIYELPFIFAVGTHEQYRHQGRAKRIISRLLTMMRDRAYGFTSLFPFPVSREFYEKMGFITFNYTKEYDLRDLLLCGTEFVFDKAPDAKKYTEIFNRHCSYFNIAQYRDEADTQKMLTEVMAYRGKILSFMHNGTCYGYIVRSKEEVEEVVVDMKYIESHKGGKFDAGACKKSVADFISETVPVSVEERLKDIVNDTSLKPYIMIRAVDIYRFVKAFIPFIDTTKETSVNIMVKDDMIGNSIINLTVSNGECIVHATPDEDVKKNVIIEEANLCRWALGEIKVADLPDVNFNEITAQYTDTY